MILILTGKMPSLGYSVSVPCLRSDTCLTAADRGRLPLPRGAIRCRKHRRYYYSLWNLPCMGDGYVTAFGTSSIGAQLVPGVIWAIIVPGMNQFFYFRYPSVTVTNNVTQLLSFPMGCLWARFLPNWKIFGVSINPGPFTIKEHVLVTIMATIGNQPAYSVRF